MCVSVVVNDVGTNRCPSLVVVSDDVQRPGASDACTVEPPELAGTGRKGGARRGRGIEGIAGRWRYEECVHLLVVGLWLD